MPRPKLGLLGLALAAGAVPALAAEGRIPIPFASPVATPILISTPGQYVLTRNLTPKAVGALIEIAGTDIDLDLNGFVLDNTPNPGSDVVVISGGPASKVTVRNGVVVGGAIGIHATAGAASVSIEDVRVADTTSAGIVLTSVTSFGVRNCTILGTDANAIVADGAGPKQGTVEGNRIKDCAGGILVSAASSVAILNNRLEHITDSPSASPLADGGIILVDSDSCLVSNNTIETVLGVGGEGMRVVDTHASKFYNNVVQKTAEHGMHFWGDSFDNLILDNVVNEAGRPPGGPVAPFDAIRVDAPGGNHVDRNVVTRSEGHGLHFGPGSADNVYGRNSGIGNSGADGCTGVSRAGQFCDDGSNFSFKDNLLPGILGLF